MAIKTTHKDVTFGVADVIRVHQRLFEGSGDKSRLQVFEGVVIAIRGSGAGKSVIVRRIGAQNVGMEFIFPLQAPTIEKIEVSRHGMKGSRHAKLYFIRDKAHREIEKIYSRTHKKDVVVAAKPKAKKTESKKTVTPKKATKVTK